MVCRDKSSRTYASLLYLYDSDTAVVSQLLKSSSMGACI